MSPLPTRPASPRILSPRWPANRSRWCCRRMAATSFSADTTSIPKSLSRAPGEPGFPASLRSAIVRRELRAPGQVGRMGEPVSVITAPARGAEAAHPAGKALHAYLSAATPGEMYAEAMSFSSGGDPARLTHGQERLRETADDYPGSFAEQMCLWDLHNYLPDDILVKVDRATMAVSIEGREPLLDHRIAEFAFRLLLHLRRGSLGPKHILRKILYKVRSQRKIVDRPKMGFGVPLLDWSRGDMKLLDRRLSRSRECQVAGPARSRSGRADGEDIPAGRRPRQGRIWTLLAFQMWRETCA